MVKVIGSLINESQQHLRRIASLEFLFDCYFEMKDEQGDVKKYIKEKLEKIDKDRASSNSGDNGQQKVSK